jgi:1-acyl-sn-glycerol-3-phosphate acyltransferase
VDWGQVDIVAGETRANVIPLHSNRGRAAARRRAVQRADASRQHPSLLADPHGGASAEQIAAVVAEIDEHRRGGGSTSSADAPLNEFAQQVAAVTGFFRQRLTGDYTVDEFGFDPHFNNAIVRPLLRFFFKSWFRVEVSGIENLPSEGAALLVANHAGVLPFDGLMLSVAVHDEHPAQRDMRLLAADMVFDLPLIGGAARKAGHTMACTTDAHRLLAAGELTAVFPEGYKGLGKPFEDRYRLQRFGRGGFVTAALRTKAPIIPCSIIGSEEIYPMLTDVKLLARLFGLPYFPVTPLFPLAGPAGLVPLPSKWRIAFGEPIYTSDYAASDAEDPMVTFELTDQVRETIQQTLYRLLAGRRNVFLG